MKNKEKYAREIIEIVCDGRILGVNKVTGKPTVCGNISCEECLRYDGHSICGRKVLREWAESEYIEKPVISKRDRAFLEYLDAGIHYIARDMNGDLFVYICKVHKLIDCWESNVCESGKNLDVFKVDFPMVKWSDGKPWLIEDLKKLEVVDEYE